MRRREGELERTPRERRSVAADMQDLVHSRLATTTGEAVKSPGRSPRRMGRCGRRSARRVANVRVLGGNGRKPRFGQSWSSPGRSSSAQRQA